MILLWGVGLEGEAKLAELSFDEEIGGQFETIAVIRLPGEQYSTQKYRSDYRPRFGGEDARIVVSEFVTDA